MRSKSASFFMFFGVWGQWRPGVSRREHFGHHFGRLCAPWGSFWRPLGSLSGPKVEKKNKLIKF